MSDTDLVTRAPDEKEAPPKETPKRTTSKRTPKRVVELESIREQLTGQLALFGGSLAFVLPVTGKATVYQASEVTDSLIKWAQTSPRVAKALLSASKVGGAFGVATATAPILIAALAELGVMNPHLAAQILPKEIAEMLVIPTPEADTEPNPNGERPEILT